MSSIRIAFSLVILHCLWACDNASTDAPEGAMDETGKVADSRPIQMHGDSMFLWTQTWNQCQVDSFGGVATLVPTTRTWKVPFEISGNRLKMDEGDLDLYDYPNGIGWSSVFERVGTGAGLVGRWRYRGTEDHPIGAASRTDTAYQARVRQRQAHDAVVARSGESREYSFTANTWTLAGSLGNMALVDSSWMVRDGVSMNLSSIQVGQNRLRLVVAETGEVVTIEYAAASRTYSSSNPAHRTYTDYFSPSNASQCNLDFWYYMTVVHPATLASE